MRFDGTLKSWNDERGFGFLAPLEGGEDVFVHITAFRLRTERPQVGQALSFEVELGPEGKTRAKNVESFGTVRRRNKPGEQPIQCGIATPLALTIFLILFVMVSIMWGPPMVMLLVYVGVSCVTFLVYYGDKSAAQRNAWRTPESTLHFLALAGGWPGALFAQQLLRHKCTKPEFRSVFWATVVLNVIVFVILSSPVGPFVSAKQ